MSESSIHSFIHSFIILFYLYASLSLCLYVYSLLFADLLDFPNSPRAPVNSLLYAWASLECMPPPHYPGTVKCSQMEDLPRRLFAANFYREIYLRPIQCEQILATPHVITEQRNKLAYQVLDKAFTFIFGGQCQGHWRLWWPVLENVVVVVVVVCCCCCCLIDCQAELKEC